MVPLIKLASNRAINGIKKKYLESIYTRVDIGNVNPLAIDVVRVRIGAID